MITSESKGGSSEPTEDWGEFHEEHFLRLAEEFQVLLEKVKIRNPQDYFMQFIR